MPYDTVIVVNRGLLFQEEIAIRVSQVYINYLITLLGSVRFFSIFI